MGGAAVSVKAVSFSPDGTLLATATASDDYSARLWVTRYSKGGDVLRQNLMSRHFI
jgi:WD40 repeat protein